MIVGKEITPRAAIIARRFELKPSDAAVIDRLLDGPASREQIACLLVDRGLSGSLEKARKSVTVHVTHARTAVEDIAQLGALAGVTWAKSMIKLTPKLRAEALYAFTEEGAAALKASLNVEPPAAPNQLALH